MVWNQKNIYKKGAKLPMSPVRDEYVESSGLLSAAGGGVSIRALDILRGMNDPLAFWQMTPGVAALERNKEPSGVVVVV